MSVIWLILDLLVKFKKPKHLFIGRLIGYFLLIVAAIIGLYFLFQALVPVVGYLESGGIFCGIFLAGGLSFLYFSQEKKQSNPMEDLLISAQEMIQNADVNVDKIKKNAPQILLVSCIVGLSLYQMKGLISDIKKKKNCS